MFVKKFKGSLIYFEFFFFYLLMKFTTQGYYQMPFRIISEHCHLCFVNQWNCSCRNLTWSFWAFKLLLRYINTSRRCEKLILGWRAFKEFFIYLKKKERERRKGQNFKVKVLKTMVVSCYVWRVYLYTSWVLLQLALWYWWPHVVTVAYIRYLCTNQYLDPLY